jgi:hypothetical protein
MYFKLDVGSIIDCEIKSGESKQNNIFKCELLSTQFFDKVSNRIFVKLKEFGQLL